MTIPAIGIAVVVTLYTERSSRNWRLTAKMAASTGLLVLVVASGAFDSSYGVLVLVALACSWCGDLLLGLSSRRAFLAGLIAFLVGHLWYVVAFAVRGLNVPTFVTTSGVVALVAVVVWRWLRQHLDRPMVPPVGAYVVVICVMVAAAAGTHGFLADWRIVAGAGAFFVSDLFVARQRFVSSRFLNRAWGLPLYYAGQILLALSVGAA